MSEELLRDWARDRVELEKQRDELARQNRIANVEKDVALQDVLLKALSARIDEAMKHMVSSDDLKALKREMEEYMNKSMRELVGEFKTILTAEQLEQSRALLSAQADTRKEILRYAIGFALTIVSALVIFYLTRDH